MNFSSIHKQFTLSNTIRRWVITVVTVILVALVGIAGNEGGKLHAAYPLIQGSELYELGYSLTAISLGGASLGLETSAETLADSPTAPAGLVRKNFFLNLFIHGRKRSGFSVGYLHPSDFGVIGFSSMVSVPVTRQLDDDFGEFFTLTGHFSKQLSKTLEIGFNLSFDYNNIDKTPSAETLRTRARSNEIPIGFHFDAALNVTPRIDIVTSSGFSFRKVRYGVAIREIGLVPFSRSGDRSLLYAETIDPILFGVGFDFLTFTKSHTTAKGLATFKGFKTRLVTELGFSYPVSFIVRSGFKSTVNTGISFFPEFSFSVGAFYNELVDTYFPFTGGMSFKFTIPETTILLRWALVLNKPRTNFGINGVTTVIGFTFTFGAVDVTPPEIDPTIFSGEGVVPLEDAAPAEEASSQ